MMPLLSSFSSAVAIRSRFLTASSNVSSFIVFHHLVVRLGYPRVVDVLEERGVRHHVPHLHVGLGNGSRFFQFENQAVDLHLPFTFFRKSTNRLNMIAQRL